MYIDKLDDIVNKHNDTYHSTIKMKSVDVKSSTLVDSSKEINDRDSNTFAKGYTPSWSEEVFVIKKV